VKSCTVLPDNLSDRISAEMLSELADELSTLSKKQSQALQAGRKPDQLTSFKTHAIG
jgi:hypothetical protein